MVRNKLVIGLSVVLISLFICNCGSTRLDKSTFCGKHLNFQDYKIGVKKIDTLNYEEGDVYSITTEDSSAILILCGGNASLLGSEKYIVTDSIYVNGRLSLKGIDSETKLYWRKYKNIAYVRVKEIDTLRYSNFLENIDLD